MSSKLLLGALLLTACTESPRSLLPDLGPLDLSTPALPPADLSGFKGTPVDFAPAPVEPPTIVSITPKLVSSAGGTAITVTGTHFSTQTDFFLNGALAEVTAVTATSATLLAPPHPGVGAATLVARNPDGTSGTNSDKTGSPSALTVFASQVSFSATQYSSFGNQPRGAAFGDLNGDGIPDMVITHISQAVFTVYLGSATAPGTFNLLSPTFSFAVIGGQGVNQTGYLADINLDGKLDLVLGTTSNQMHYYLGTGTGFVGSGGGATQDNYGASGNVVQQAVFDYTGDKYDDIITANNNANNIGFFINTQNPANLYPSGQISAISISQPTRVVNYDIDGDGKQDFVVSSQNNNNATLYVYFGNQNGGSQPFVAASPSTYGLNALNQQTTWVELGDLNGDGKIDAVVVDSNTGTIRVFLGNGTQVNAFQSAMPPVQVGLAPQQVALGDFNGDGKLDAAVTNTQSSTVSLLLGNGDGTFAPRQDIPSLNQPWGIYALDLNGDKRTDLAVVNAFNGQLSTNPGLVTIYLNNSQ